MIALAHGEGSAFADAAHRQRQGGAAIDLQAAARIVPRFDQRRHSFRTGALPVAVMPFALHVVEPVSSTRMQSCVRSDVGLSRLPVQLAS